MNHRTFAHILFAAALIGAPTVALAQSQPDDWNHQSQQQRDQWNRDHQRGADTRNNRDQRDRDQRDRDERRNPNGERRDDQGRWNNTGNNGRWNGGYNPGTYNNGNYNGGYNPGRYNGGYSGSGRIGGVVQNFSPFNLDLSNGEHVNLHQGTVINPTGVTLSPGMRVSIVGHSNGNGTFEADRIDVLNGR